MPVGSLQEAALVQHFAVVCKLFECADVPVDAGDVCCSGDFCAHGMELPGDEPVPCELSTIFSSVLDDPHVAGLDTVDGAAGWMDLNDVYLTCGVQSQM